MARSEEEIFPIYFGDDQTDEDAFYALKEKGMGVKVTEKVHQASQASYCVRSTEEVLDFLRRLKTIRK